ncbi:MAG: glutaminase [Lutibacter sp.]
MNTSVNYPELFSSIFKEINLLNIKGERADYIPELQKVNPNKFGVTLTDISKKSFQFGDANEKFSIQSIAKVFGLVLAYKIKGESLWKRVGVEPSETPFNSFVQLENNAGVPRNPLINSGAIVIADVLISELKNPKKEFLAFVQSLSNNSTINYSKKIAESEKSTGFRNAALVNLMKSFGNIKNEVEEVMDFYFYLCSIEMTTKELANSFLFLANYGVNPYSLQQVISVSKAKRINAIMQICGFYDEAGEFSFKVGLPGKSGVGGGIAAVHPGKYSLAVWSPELNKKGNSAKGFKFLELFTTETETSIF